MTSPYLPTGTVYGTLLNHRVEWDAWSPRMSEAPYKAAPKAPVLYVKTANTFNPSGGEVRVPTSAARVEIGATLGVVFGAARQIAGYVLLNDFSLPHASFFRPPVRFKCLDGFLGVGAPVPAAELQDTSRLALEVRVDGVRVQSFDFSQLIRPEARLIAEVDAFMTLREGDVLMLGLSCDTDGQRPQAAPGQRVEVLAPGFAPLVHTLAQEAA